ncbi:MAG: hypothetical protein RIC19_00725 [Phaeodactylibacter sp.]|uniref:hypothetical protein n=1 Tax=Phaeodactylibacter sp. TaxID=1940289 RepID=UPI0032ECBD3C
MRIFLSLMCTVLAVQLSAQPPKDTLPTPAAFGPYYTQLGADLLPAIIAGGGGNLGYYQIEALYREHRPGGDLRIKVEVNNKDYFEGFTPYPGQLLPGSTPEDPRYHQNDLLPRTNLLFSAGLSTYRFSKKLPVYFGADAQAGVLFTERITYINSRPQDQMPGGYTQILSTANHSHVLVGLTPFVGTNIPLTSRLSFSIEFGLPIIYHTGTTSYVTENGDRFDSDISEFNLFDNRPINDLAIFYRL